MALHDVTCRSIVLIMVATAVFQRGNCSQSQILQEKYQIPNHFGQDLTIEIDKVLNENNLTYKAVIKEALRWSHIVYYESDILLDELENIIPVIDLLDELKPEKSSPVKITLSLPYLSKTEGTFLSRRLSDIYYNFEANISANSRTKLLASLASFTLNFVSSHNYQMAIPKYGNQLHDFLFVNYVKNFVSLYFGHEAIPVGIMWNEKMESSGSVNSQIPEADFLIFYTEYDFNYKFPVFLEKFYFYMQYVLRLALKNETIFMKTTGQISQEVNSLWKNDAQNSDCLRNAVYKASQFKNVSELFVSKLSQKSGKLFDCIKLSWATLKNRDVIVGNALQNLSVELSLRQNVDVKLILPFIQIEEVKLDMCTVNDQLKKWSREHETVVMNEMSWRTVARFKDDLTGNLLNCNGLSANQTLNQPETLNVMLEFTNGIASQWNILGSNLVHLIRSYPKISKMALDTLIFYEGDIKSLEIQQVINSTKPYYKIGCSAQYESIITLFDTYYYRHGHSFLENTFKEALKGTLCAPIFELLDVMIWYAPELERNDRDGNYYFKDRIFSAYSNIFLTRELFQNVFPNKKVYIKFSSHHDKRILADLFDVPIIVPSDQLN